jgi:tripartite-type tricarboxylate transporter receptor subunit TctC
MINIRSSCLGLASAILLMLPFGVQAQDSYPSKPIEVILPAAPGGTTDLALRLMAEKWQEELGQPVLVVNRPGAGGALGADIVANAEPDGYTLMGAFDSIVVALPLVHDVSYDIDSFTYLNGFGKGAIYFMVREDAPWQTLEEFVADAKSRPGELTYASYGKGVITHFTAERLWELADVNLEYITYQSSPESATAMLGGHVDMAVTAGTGGVGKSGQVRILGVAGEERRPDYPEVPTLIEQGYDVSLDYVSAILAPAGLPDDIRARLEEVISNANEEHGEEFQKQLLAGDLIHINMSGDELRQTWAERREWFEQVAPRLGLEKE